MSPSWLFCNWGWLGVQWPWKWGLAYVITYLSFRHFPVQRPTFSKCRDMIKIAWWFCITLERIRVVFELILEDGHLLNVCRSIFREIWCASRKLQWLLGHVQNDWFLASKIESDLHSNLIVGIDVSLDLDELLYHFIRNKTTDLGMTRKDPLSSRRYVRIGSVTKLGQTRCSTNSQFFNMRIPWAKLPRWQSWLDWFWKVFFGTIAPSVDSRNDINF